MTKNYAIYYFYIDSGLSYHHNFSQICDTKWGWPRKKALDGQAISGHTQHMHHVDTTLSMYTNIFAMHAVQFSMCEAILAM